MGKRRGRETLVTCEVCHQRVPKDHAVSTYNRRTGLKIWLCIKCAKKRGLVGKWKKPHK